MELEIKFRATKYTPENGNKTISFEDLTGDYSSPDNIGGYGGGVNPERNTLGIFIVGAAFTVASLNRVDIPLNYSPGDTSAPSTVSKLFLQTPIDGNYSLEYIGVTSWDASVDYSLDQAIFFEDQMYVASDDIPLGQPNPSIEPLWTVVQASGTVPTIAEVIRSPSQYTKTIETYPGNTVVLSTIDSDRRLVDMVTAKEEKSSFIDGTLDTDEITRYRVLLYGAKANSFIECDVNAVYMLKGCDDIFKQARIRNSSL